LNLSKIRALCLPIAPIAEQRQIVEAIEEQFSRLDAAEASLSRAGANLRRFRAALINKALAQDWPLVELDEVIKSLKNGVFVSRPSKSPPGVPIFRISAVRPMRLDLTDVRYAPALQADVDDYFVRPGDLLFTRYSGNPTFVGACAVVPEGVAPTLHPDKLIRVVVDEERAIPEFVAMSLNHGNARKNIEGRLKTTAGQVGIAGSQLRSVPFALPPLDVQQNVLADMSHKLSICDSQMKMIDREQEGSRRLRRALLDAASSGKLAARAENGSTS
jgi:type I restriction enzyme S subunit